MPNNPEIDQIKFYYDIIAAYKDQLEQWHVENNNLYAYFMLTIITVWVVIFPKSRLYYYVFSGLPKSNHNFNS